MTDWRDVVGFENCYQVSDTGQVKSLARQVERRDGNTMSFPGKIKIPRKHPKGGYLYVDLYKGNRQFTMKVHRLVLEAFVGPCPDNAVTCHNDGDTANNQLTNLRWDTASSNNFDLVRHGTHFNANKTHCPQGHPYDTANLYRPPSQPRARRCRECMRVYRKRRYWAVGA